MTAIDPSQFYTGLVAQAYGPLRSAVPDVGTYARFIEVFGEPALELGCGDGDPMLALLQRGIEVEGLDASSDMLARCRLRAEAAGLDAVVHQNRIQDMALGKRYRSIFLAGATFNLLPDDDAAGRALARIAQHLEPDGAALIPLIIPEPDDNSTGRPRTHREPDGTVLKVTILSIERDEATRQQRSLLRYESSGPSGASALDRVWILHWHTQESFTALAITAGLRVVAVLDTNGDPAAPDAAELAFVLARAV